MPGSNQWRKNLVNDMLLLLSYLMGKLGDGVACHFCGRRGRCNDNRVTWFPNTKLGYLLRFLVPSTFEKMYQLNVNKLCSNLKWVTMTSREKSVTISSLSTEVRPIHSTVSEKNTFVLIYWRFATFCYTQRFSNEKKLNVLS